jgi:hypothetical protein
MTPKIFCARQAAIAADLLATLPPNTALRSSPARPTLALAEARWWSQERTLHLKTMAAIRVKLSRIEVDYLKVKPRVKVTGEFFLKHAGTSPTTASCTGWRRRAPR